MDADDLLLLSFAQRNKQKTNRIWFHTIPSGENTTLCPKSFSFFWKQTLSVLSNAIILCVCVCVCMCMCVCVCSSNISADQDQADLRVSTWLLFGSRVCNVRFVWTTMISLINYFTNALQILQALSTRATTVTCAPEPITAELTSTTYLKKKSRFIPAAVRAGPRFCRRFGPVLFCASKLTVVD